MPHGQSLAGMAIRIVSFIAIVLTALALVPYAAHLFSLPNKIGMTEQQYFIAQMVYRNWSLMGAILFPAMLMNVVLAVMLRGAAPAFALAVAGCVCMVATLAIFFAWTYPANVATQDWTVVPANWQDLRQQWEYSHAVNAILNFLALCLIVAASLASRR
jgi:hypothetical protein